MLVELYAKTDIGRVRRGNEDNLLLLDLSARQAWTATDGDAPLPELCRFEVGEKGAVLAVSDGMGGALAGDVASRMAVETVREMLTEAQDETTETGEPGSLIEALLHATVYANLAINHRSHEDSRFSGMGATFTGAAIENGKLGLTQVGDSRAYLLRDGAIKLLTKDQSLVQQLIDDNRITEEEAETHMFRNVILQALGAQSEIYPAIGDFPIRRGDVLLLCSDGLSGKLRASDMQSIINPNKDDLASACEALINEANERGGEDNITVVLARFDGDDLPSFDDEDETLTGEQEVAPQSSTPANAKGKQKK